MPAASSPNDFSDPKNIIAPMFFAVDHGIAAIHATLDYAIVRASVATGVSKNCPDRGQDAMKRLKDHECRLLSLLGTLSWKPLRCAISLVQQMRENVYEEDIYEHIKSRKAKIIFDTQRARGMDKIMRLHSVTSTIENGLVCLPTEAPWLKLYLHELTTFPAAKHDDQTDSTSQALDWIKQGTHLYGVHDFFCKQIGTSLDDADIFSSDVPLNCPKCRQAGPGGRRRIFHCNQCGYEWKDVAYWKEEPDIRRCRLANGELAVLDEGRQLWVNTLSGETYAPQETNLT